MYYIPIMVRVQKRQRKAYRRQYYLLNRSKALRQRKENYTQNADVWKAARRDKYASNPKRNRAVAAARGKYAANPEPKRAAARGRYASNPGPKKTAASKHYAKYRSAILQRLRIQYYSSIVHRRAARLLQHARNRCRENAKSKAYRQRNMRNILLMRRGRYVLTEPKMDMKGKYVENLQQCIRSKVKLREKLLQAFRSSFNMLDDESRGFIPRQNRELTQSLETPIYC